jgi:hypothetical protein
MTAKRLAQPRPPLGSGKLLNYLLCAIMPYHKNGKSAVSLSARTLGSIRILERENTLFPN